MTMRTTEELTTELLAQPRWRGCSRCQSRRCLSRSRSYQKLISIGAHVIGGS